jgi:PadR family transcriptional regulator, regulatory protein AphA
MRKRSARSTSQPPQLGTLAYVLLGAIAREPSTGYDLRGYIERRVSHYFSAHLSQIYPELARLLEAGFVDVDVVEQSKAPAKKVYKITTKGREALRAWVVQPLPVAQPKLEILTRTHAVWTADPKKAAAIYLELAEACAAERKHFEEVIARLVAQHGEPKANHPVFSDLANLRYGIGSMKQQEAWCRQMVERLLA